MYLEQHLKQKGFLILADKSFPTIKQPKIKFFKNLKILLKKTNSKNKKKLSYICYLYIKFWISKISLINNFLYGMICNETDIFVLIEDLFLIKLPAYKNIKLKNINSNSNKYIYDFDNLPDLKELWVLFTLIFNYENFLFSRKLQIYFTINSIETNKYIKENFFRFIKIPFHSK